MGKVLLLLTVLVSGTLSLQCLSCVSYGSVTEHALQEDLKTVQTATDKFYSSTDCAAVQAGAVCAGAGDDRCAKLEFDVTGTNIAIKVPIVAKMCATSTSDIAEYCTNLRANYKAEGLSADPCNAYV